MSTFRKATPGVRLGRPPKPEGRGRNRRVVTFVTEDEYAELKMLASDGSISLSALCNDMVTTAIHRFKSGVHQVQHPNSALQNLPRI